jgi:hypothetical protein
MVEGAHGGGSSSSHGSWKQRGRKRCHPTVTFQDHHPGVCAQLLLIFLTISLKGYPPAPAFVTQGKIKCLKKGKT